VEDRGEWNRRKVGCKLKAGHSIECIADADHSIALSKTVLRCCVIMLRDRRAGPSHGMTTQCNETVPHYRLHFVTLWPWPFDLIFIGGRSIVKDYPCAKFGDLGLSRFGFIVQTDTQIDRQTKSQRRMIAILMRLLSASVTMNNRCNHLWRKIDKINMRKWFYIISIHFLGVSVVDKLNKHLKNVNISPSSHSEHWTQ